MKPRYTVAELEAYLEESLPADEMTAIEQSLRSEPDLLEQLTVINGRRDAGVHTLGEIWRRHRVSCLERTQLGSLLLGVLDPDVERYARFHLEVVGCRLCQANLADLQAQQASASNASAARRTKYFQSSAGYLPRP